MIKYKIEKEKNWIGEIKLFCELLTPEFSDVGK